MQSFICEFPLYFALDGTDSTKNRLVIADRPEAIYEKLSKDPAEFRVKPYR